MAGCGDTQNWAKRYSCSGTPADCIIFGMSQILDQPPDLVLTGINHGMNVADDILYSGHKPAGAMEVSITRGASDCQAVQRHGRDDIADYAPSQRL